MILFGIKDAVHHNTCRTRERQRGKGEGVEPDTVEGSSEDAITFVDVVYAQTATVGEEGGEDVDVDGAGGAAGGFPSLATPLSRSG